MRRRSIDATSDRIQILPSFVFRSCLGHDALKTPCSWCCTWTQRNANKKAANKAVKTYQFQTIGIKVRTCSCGCRKESSIYSPSTTGLRSILDQLTVNPPFTLPHDIHWLFIAIRYEQVDQLTYVYGRTSARMISPLHPTISTAGNNAFGVRWMLYDTSKVRQSASSDKDLLTKRSLFCIYRKFAIWYIEFLVRSIWLLCHFGGVVIWRVWVCVFLGIYMCIFTWYMEVFCLIVATLLTWHWSVHHWWIWLVSIDYWLTSSYHTANTEN